MSAYPIVIIEPENAANFACDQFVRRRARDDRTVVMSDGLWYAARPGIPVHMHVMTAKVERNKELECHGVVGIC